MKSREKNIKKIMREENIDALIVSSPENFHYVTGTASHQHVVSRMPAVSMALVNSDDNIQTVAICMDFEKKALEDRVDNCKVVQYDTWVGVKTFDKLTSSEGSLGAKNFKSFSGSLDILINLIKEYGLENKTIGLELDFISINYFNLLKEKLPNIIIKNSSPLFIKARSVKTKEEIDIIKKIANVGALAMLHTSKFAKPGITEKELMDIYRLNVMESKICVPSTWSAFLTGENASALAISGNTIVKDTDIIKFDGGVNAEWDFYTTDMSRAWVMPNADKELFKLKDTLYESRTLMIENIKPNVPFSEIFNIGFEYVKKKYPGYERGHMGHSISMGPQTAEAPFVSKNETRVIEENMVLCIESPCYIEGIGGYNIEDMIVVTKDGCEIITDAAPHYID